MASSEDALEARIGAAFRDRELLRRALTHSSASEGKRSLSDYQRLEFLGDRVLGLVVAQHLLDRFPSEEEGRIALRFNAIVSGVACARAARRVDLGSALYVSKSEDKTGARDNESILANACEALIAALYLEGGIEAARGFIELAWADELNSTPTAPQDPKTLLQEWAAQRKRPNPRYDVIERSGPDHAPRFVVEASVEGLDAMRGEGGSKRDAEREAARALLNAVGVGV